jgi:Transglutaminase-like superfamily
MRSCVVGDQVVLLDLKRSRYLGLSRRQWNSVTTSTGPDGANASHAHGRSGSGSRPFVESLLRKRILTTAPAPRERQPAHLLSPATSIDVRRTATDPHISAADICRFAGAAALAALWLRFRSLDSITRFIEGRHRECDRRDTTRAARLTRSVAVFDRLRPLAFTSKDKCLYDSLTLTIFLAGRSIAAQWVIGVAARPFEAHSWVQDGSEVLNDLHENVGRFTPLLVV